MAVAAAGCSIFSGSVISVVVAVGCLLLPRVSICRISNKVGVAIAAIWIEARNCSGIGLYKRVLIRAIVRRVKNVMVKLL
jgi:hypothetical protein